MAKQTQSEFTESELQKLLDRFAYVIVKPQRFRRGDFDIINFHETQNFEDHTLGSIITMLEKYNAKERSILEILYDHLSRPGAGVGVPAPDDYSEEEEESGVIYSKPQDSPNQKWCFNNTFLLMEHGLKLMMESELSPEPQNNRDRRKKDVLKWSVELWFLGQVSHCENDDVSRALQKITNELFARYLYSDFGPEDECRFTILREEDCTDLVNLLLTKGDFGLQLETHLNDSKNFKEFNAIDMSRTMIKMISSHSSVRYIIPRNGLKSRAYGFYVTGVFLGYSATLEDSSEYKELKKAYERAGLYDPMHFDELLIALPMPNRPREENVGWSTDQLCREIKNRLEIIENIPPTCSLLFLALSFHGSHEYVRSLEIRELLKVLQERKKLEGIPKVIKKKVE